MTSEALLEDKQSYANDALAEARRDLIDDLPEGTVVEGDLDYLIQARATDSAAFALATQVGTLGKSILYLIYQMELNQFYRVLPQEFSTLREWAKFRFAKLYEGGHISEDYILRFCGTVEDMLIPVHEAHLRGLSEVSAEDVIRHASEAQLKENRYYFKSARPEEQAELIEALATPTKDIGERREKNAKIDGIKTVIRVKNGVTPIILYAETTADGLYDLHGKITHDDLMFLMNLLGKRLDLHLAGAA